MRYERVEDILKLALLMQTSSNGLSLYDIQDHFRVSRRTAERMRDAVVRLFPQIEEVETHSKIKRWAIRKQSLASMVAFTSDELAELENTKKKFEIDGLNNKADTIDDIIAKIKVMNKDYLSKLETDIEAVMQAEGYAIRQHPRFKIDNEILIKIREAIKSFKVLEIEYENKNKEIQTCNIDPYGVLYGEKNYLVAYNENRKAIRLYILSKIKSIKILDEYFEKDENFNLDEYAKNSFGIYQEKPQQIVLKFDKSVADDVMNFHFHPTQKIKEEKDGSIKVEFTAGGSLEICWHIFKWGDKATIVKPLSLKNTYKSLLIQALNADE
jgi:predicted DNA-binding transcriptional regulator YafY